MIVVNKYLIILLQLICDTTLCVLPLIKMAAVSAAGNSPLFQEPPVGLKSKICPNYCHHGTRG